MQPTSIGIIGLGLIWIRVHKPILDTLSPVFQPVALCDTSEMRRQDAQKTYPEAQVFAAYTELLRVPEIEAVVILTPIALNAPIALAALKAGKHVIMEKPIARSSAEGQHLLAVAQTMGKRLIVLEQMGFQQNAETLIRLIQTNQIGELVTWDRVQHAELDTAQGAMRYDTTPWRKTADFPLGTLFDGGIHVIANLTRLFGMPQYVSATGQRLRPEYGHYDQVSILFHYENGLSGTFSHSSYLPSLANHFYIYGSQGVIRVERHQLTLQKPAQADQIIELPAENPYHTMWGAIARYYHQGHPLPYPPTRAVQDVTILEMVDQAIKAKKTMQLPPV